MSKKFLSLFFVLAMLLGGAAACSDDSGDDGGSEDSGDSGTTSDNPDVQAYCDDVAALADEIESADGDPTALADLSTQATDLTASGGELSGSDLSTEDAEAISDCSQQLTDAVASFAG